jgi:hypothetical protein
MADEQQSMSVSGWGKKFGVTGPNAFPWLVIIILLGGIGYMVTFSLGKWGPPINLHQGLLDQAVIIADHTLKMSGQHTQFEKSLYLFTYVNWVCSPLNTNPEAKRKCSDLDLMTPEALEGKQRR